DRDHGCRKDMRPWRHQLAAEQQHAKEPGLQEEGGETFISKQRRQDVRSRRGVLAPIRAELERHHDAGDDAHAEGDGEDLGPEYRNAGVYLATSREVETLDHGDE